MQLVLQLKTADSGSWSLDKLVCFFGVQSWAGKRLSRLNNQLSTGMGWRIALCSHKQFFLKVRLIQSYQLSADLRRLERVFRCYLVCETKEDYKEGCLMVWENYMSPCNSIVGLYFKGTCDVISVTMATHKVHKSGL